MTSTQASLDQIKKELAQVSPSFCTAKWLQVTMHLQNGQTHSCHHPRVHLVPLKEIAQDPSALHNTKQKKQARKQMLEGQRPPECSYCWTMEDLSKDLYSDRHIKSNDDWSRSHLQEIARSPWDQNVNPSYAEVAFSNTCNFKCAYCAPHVSSKWMAEIKEHGPYPTRKQFGSLRYLKKNKLMPFEDGSSNPYIQAFWKWWPELYNTLKVFRITGGEPLLSQNTFKVLDYIAEHPNRNLELIVNSNLGVPTELVEKFAKKIAGIREKKLVKNVEIYTSIDTWGEHAEFLRTGLDLKRFRANIDVLYQHNEELKIVIMCAFNALSVFRFKELIDFVIDQKTSLGRDMVLDIACLRYPDFLDVKILPAIWKSELNEILNYMKMRRQNSEKVGLNDYEIIKMERLIEYANSKAQPGWIKIQRRDFVSFIEEFDKRRSTDFIKDFPEFKDIFLAWKACRPRRNIVDFIHKQFLG